MSEAIPKSEAAFLSEANLQGADLSSLNFKAADLSSANLITAVLTQTNLSGAQLQGAQIQGGNLANADIRGADLGQTKTGMASMAVEVSDLDQLNTVLQRLKKVKGVVSIERARSSD